MSSRFSLFSLISVVFLFVLSLGQYSFAQDEASADTEESMAEASDMSEASEADAVEIVSARYFCELQGLTRRIEIDYEASDSSVPCSVNYYKDTEAPGEVNTLWTATNVEGYCEQKAAGFIEKLKSWGWSCREG